MNKVIVALDVASVKDAKKLVQKLSPSIRYFKVGSELFTACGPEIISYIRKKRCKVFLDLKFHDIPNTVYSATKSALKLGVSMVNVHALGGEQMMRAAARAVKESGKKVTLIGVTVLTSMKASDIKSVGVHVSVEAQALKLARLAKKSGLDGVVASGQEAPHIRQSLGKRFVIVTPGVRPRWAAKGDQKRIVTPHQAFQKGADFIVVGRPITGQKDPLQAAKRILKELQSKLGDCPRGSE